MNRLSHTDESGAARMVDVTAKDVTHRVATARGFVETTPESWPRRGRPT